MSSGPQQAPEPHVQEAPPPRAATMAPVGRMASRPDSTLPALCFWSAPSLLPWHPLFPLTSQSPGQLLLYSAPFLCRQHSMVTGLPGESQDQPLILNLRVLLGKMITFLNCYFFSPSWTNSLGKKAANMLFLNVGIHFISVHWFTNSFTKIYKPDISRALYLHHLSQK